MPSHTAHAARPGALARASRPARTAVAACAVVGGLLLTGCSLTAHTMKTVRADATVAEAVTAVEITGARHGSIEVTPGSGPGVAVHRTVHYRGDTAPRPGQHVSGGLLTFDSGCTGSCYVDYRLEVPASATVKLESSSGRVTVTGVAAADVETSSGDVELERIAGALKARTSSGDITGSALAGPGADIRSTSGDARLAFTASPNAVAAETGSGNVTLTVPSAPYRVDVSTTSGDRRIALPTDPAAGARLSVRTTSGDVRVSAA
ncbi:DUF4097 domain-containing protein [Streptomyces sp. NPDC059999]|uniref:DUF4097 family beta strand repeat-containing protein n=1 Tax=Streptomyces sp. NPDC059999 TaxID=3347030 RepID=UPI0036A43CCB